ncbi:MAG: ABC transporter substrate-binding protein [Betaproteobacteria bacterium]|nr:ABC transporter substrate-binding protein [Betaproteobacteria bacterium]
MPVIGFLSSRSPGESAHLVAAFREGLREAGYVEGQNVTIEYRWAEGEYDRLPALAAELVRKRVAVIATAGGTPSALAAKAASATVPIVFLSGGDLVKLGLVSALNRPGGNMTGVSQFTTVLAAKRLEVLHELTPASAVFAMLVNPANPNIEIELANAQEAARTLKRKLHVVKASGVAEIDMAFSSLLRQKIRALSVSADPFLDGRRAQIVGLAARYAIPAVYAVRENVTSGGLASYGINFADTYLQAGRYTARVLKGDRPADLPVLQPTKFELVINLKTAKALGVKIPQSVLVRVDEVIR